MSKRIRSRKPEMARDFDRAVRRDGVMTALDPGYRRHLLRSAERLRSRLAGFEAVPTEPMDGWQTGIVHSFSARRPR